MCVMGKRGIYIIIIYQTKFVYIRFDIDWGVL